MKSANLGILARIAPGTANGQVWTTATRACMRADGAVDFSVWVTVFRWTALP